LPPGFPALSTIFRKKRFTEKIGDVGFLINDAFPDQADGDGRRP